MKLKPVYDKLALRVPRFTNLFTDQLTVSSLTQSSGTATIVTSSPHGFAVSSTINTNIQSARTRTVISSVSFVGNIATAITATDHDLTLGYPGYETITIANSSESELNGTFSLTDVQNRRKFSFQVDTVPGSVTTPGDLLEDKLFGYNGFQAATVVDSTTLTFPVDSSVSSPADGNIILHTPPRIATNISIEHAAAAYTAMPQGKYWMFLMPGQNATSLDRRNNNDGRSFLQEGAAVLVRIISNFSIFIAAPTSQTFDAVEINDDIAEARAAIYKSIAGDQADTEFTGNSASAIAPTLDEPVLQFIGDNAQPVYGHTFDFEVQTNIVEEDVFLNDRTAAFRDVEYKFFNEFDDSGEIIMTANVDLDDEPLP